MTAAPYHIYVECVIPSRSQNLQPDAARSPSMTHL